jgi:hypothetical protein
VEKIAETLRLSHGDLVGAYAEAGRWSAGLFGEGD